MVQLFKIGVIWMDEWYANDGETLVSESTPNLSDAQNP